MVFVVVVVVVVGMLVVVDCEDGRTRLDFRSRWDGSQFRHQRPPLRFALDELRLFKLDLVWRHVLQTRSL